MPEQCNAIVERCIKGDNNAWESLVKRFSGLIMWSVKSTLLKFGYQFTDNDVEDIHQEVFLSLYNENKLLQLKDTAKIAPWLCIISGNIAINFIRRRRGRIAKESISLFEEIAEGEDKSLTILDTLSSDEPSPRETLDNKLKQESLNEAIDSLNPKEKLIMHLYFVYENSIKEIAAHLNMPEGTVASIIGRAKEKIRQILKEKNL